MTAATPQSTTDHRKLIPLREATHLLGLKDPRTTKKLVREGRLVARRLGDRIMIEAKSIQRLCDGEEA